MLDRRNETRMLCADLVEIQWREGTRTKKAIANLEDISLSGACLQTEVPVPLEAIIKIAHPNGNLIGRVRHCAFCEIGYYLGVEFDPGVKWSQNEYKPRHLLDPRRLAVRAAQKVADEPPET